MKIFDWVQKRLHHNVLKDGLAKNVKKTDSIAIDNNTQALLEQVAFVDVLEGWREGILTIGTFGFDTLKPSNERKEYFFMESEEEEEEDDDDDYDEDDYVEGEQFSVNDDDDNDNNVDEEANPLIFTTFEHNFEDIGSHFYDHQTVRKPDVMMTVDGLQLGPIVDVMEVDQGKKRRTTLAELFLADSDIKKKPTTPLEFEVNISDKKPPSLRSKNGISFAKKLIPHVGEDSRPIKKLHQMMKRMLKRKIHPEHEGKAYKSDGLEFLTSKKHEAGETVSLLQTSDATV